MEPMFEKILQDAEKRTDDYYKNPTVDYAVRRGLLVCAELFDVALSPSQLPIWTTVLHDCKPFDIDEAFARIARTFIPSRECRFPVPAHIVREIERIRKQREAEFERAAFDTAAFDTSPKKE